MGGTGSGRRDRKDACVHGHDLTAPGAVRLVRRGKYTERQCRECTRLASQRWRARNPGYVRPDRTSQAARPDAGGGP